MKSIKKSVLFVLTGILVAISFTACSDENDNPVQVTAPSSIIYPASDVHATASGYVKVKFNKQAGSLTNSNEFKPEDLEIVPVSEGEAITLSTGEAGEDGKSVWSMYKWVTLNYRCITADGSMKDLSELVVWPYRWGSDRTPSQLMIGCHSTISSDEQRPTNFSKMSSAGEINMLALFASVLSQNALVIVPDYEGYGSTVTSPHPYLNRELTAEQVVTGAKAGLSYFEGEVMKMADNWSGAVIGYSQGGAVAASVLRYCQQKGDNSLRVKGAVCGDGPYDPVGTLKRYIAMDKLYMPIAPTLMLKGAIDTDPEMKAAGCEYLDFVTDKFYKTGIFEMIAAKQASTDEIQTALLNHSLKYGDNDGFVMKAKTSEGYLPYTQNNLVDASGKQRDFKLDNGKGNNFCTVDQCLKPGVIAFFRDGTILGDVPESKLKALEKSLAKNALTADGFVPGCGFTFFHSTGDEIVPFCNLETVRTDWGTDQIKSLSFQSYISLHVATGAVFYLYYCGSLVDEILNDKWAPSEQSVG